MEVGHTSCGSFGRAGVCSYFPLGSGAWDRAGAVGLTRGCSGLALRDSSAGARRRPRKLPKPQFLLLFGSTIARSRSRALAASALMLVRSSPHCFQLTNSQPLWRKRGGQGGPKPSFVKASPEGMLRQSTAPYAFTSTITGPPPQIAMSQL